MIRVLIDENLPAGLMEKLGVPGMHATDLGCQPTDRELWDHARHEGWILLTKDADFFDQLVLYGAPPKVVWLRTGNLRRLDLENLLVTRWGRIEELLTGADLVEVHADKLEAIALPH